MIAVGFWRNLLSFDRAGQVSFAADLPQTLLSAMTEGGTLAPRVSRAEALQVPAVLRSRNLIAGVIGSLPLVTIDPGKREIPGTYLLGGNIDSEVPNSVLVAYTVEDLLFEGVAWWRVSARGFHGFPTHARWVPTSSVHVAQDGGLLPSQMRIDSDQPFPAEGTVYIDGIPVPDADIIRFDSPNPPLLRHAARAIRTALKLDSAAAVYADEPLPLTVFTPRDRNTVEPDRAKIEEMLDQWEQARRKRATGYVGAALQLDTVGWSPEQLQLADARQHAVLEIARAAGLDPEDLGVSTTSRTYQNADQRRRDLLDFTLGAYVTAMQHRLSMRDVLPRGYQAKIKFDGFLRSDAKTRMETYKIGLDVGAYTGPEIRELEDRPPLRAAAVTEGSQMSVEDPAATFARVRLAAADHGNYTTQDAGDLNAAARRYCIARGWCRPDGSYPIRPADNHGRADLDKAVHAVGRGGGSHDAIRAHIIRRARAIGLSELIPENWTASGGMRADSDDALISFDDPEAYATFRVNEAKRTISGMVVPWGKPAVSGGSRWRFAENSLRWGDWSRIKLNLGHQRDQTVGYAALLKNTSQGLDATFKIAEVPEGDRALALAAGKAWDGLSIEIGFEDESGDDWQPDPTDGSTRVVRQAKLTGVALTPAPAFDDARVLTVAASRTQPQEDSHGRDGRSTTTDGQLRGRPAGAGRRVRVRLRPVH